MTTWTVSATVEADTAEQAVALAREGNMLAKRKARKEPKPFQPKSWKPGMEYVLEGVRYQVWAETPRWSTKCPHVWAVPSEPRPDGAPIVELSPSYRNTISVVPFGTNGERWERAA